MDGTLYYVHQDHPSTGSGQAWAPPWPSATPPGKPWAACNTDPYGEVITSTLPATLTDRLFTGARFDGTIGLYQMGARWYDPALGRWIQVDAIVPEPGNPQALNRYTYVYNNPLKYMDPSGHQGIPGKLKRAIANFITTSAEISHKVYYTAAEDNNRLKRINVPSLLDLTYTYDGVGNVESIADTVLAQTQSFGCDFLNRLTSAQADGSQGAYAHSYAYDEIGNITDLAGVTYSYQGSQPHAVTDLSDGSHFAYDANGNMALRVEISGTQVITYEQAFDIENRLEVVTDTVAVEATRFFYDGDGARVKKVDSSGATYYVGNYYEEFVPQGSGPMAWLTGAGRGSGMAAPLKLAGPSDSSRRIAKSGGNGLDLAIQAGQGDRTHLENDRYRAEFDENGLRFTARGDDGQTASLSYRLSAVRSGQQVYFDSVRWAGRSCPANAVFPRHCYTELVKVSIIVLTEADSWTETKVLPSLNRICSGAFPNAAHRLTM